MKDIKYIINKLYECSDASDADLHALLDDSSEDEYLRALAEKKRTEIYGKDVYIRGLIEVSSYCKNNCFYCGIRAKNTCAQRYRLSKEQILSCCKVGYDAGFRTFVLQGGEDPFFTDELVEDIVSSIKALYPDCAVTLSLGEKSYESYLRFHRAGADRYLLRHETADRAHYESLHPDSMSFENRMRCLKDLKEIGYQTGCGFMVGSPHQTTESIIKDLRFIKEFSPQMVGIGPFIPHKDTPFAGEPTGSVELTLKLLSIIRLMNPRVLLPATTALGTASADGRSRGILAGANVIMPNLSPEDARGKYMLYNGKINTGIESVEGLSALDRSMNAIGYHIAVARGDYKY